MAAAGNIAVSSYTSYTSVRPCSRPMLTHCRVIQSREAMPQASTFCAFSMVGHFHSCQYSVVVHQLVVGYMYLQNPSNYFVKAVPVVNNQQESVVEFSATEGECSGGGSGTLQVWGAIGLVWGNQETIWTLSWGAMTSRPSARILSLSKPKKDFSKYQCSCRPVIGGRPPLAKFGYPSERLLKLAEPRKFLPAYLEQRARESPEWPVSLAARNYNASQRILELAQPKLLHPEFVPAREVPTRVSSFATSASASVRVQQLAGPLIRELTCCSRHTHPGSGMPMVSRSAQKAIASPRTIELSRPKQLHADYAPPRDPEWPVTEAAKRAVATPRVLELAQPGIRPRMGLTTFNPDAFKVKESAMKAACSMRLQELAQPIQR